jgi:hypothetical protein
MNLGGETLMTDQNSTKHCKELALNKGISQETLAFVDNNKVFVV